MSSIINKNFFPGLVIVVFFVLSGCGYSFRKTGMPIGTNIPSIAIPMVESPSSSLGFESDLTEMIRKEFISHSRIPLVGRDTAKTVLIGKVETIEKDPLSYSLTEVAVPGGGVAVSETTGRRWLKVSMNVKLLESGSHKVLWEEKSMQEKAFYAVGSDPLANRYNERNALRVISERLAEKIYNKTMERF